MTKQNEVHDLSTIRGRLKVFIEYMGTTNSRFCRAIGMSQGYVNAINKSIGADVMDKIEAKFPQLNRRWLLYGDGEMLYSEMREPTPEERVEELKTLYRTIEHLTEMLNAQSQNYRDSLEVIRQLIERNR